MQVPAEVGRSAGREEAVAPDDEVSEQSAKEEISSDRLSKMLFVTLLKDGCVDGTPARRPGHRHEQVPQSRH